MAEENTISNSLLKTVLKALKQFKFKALFTRDILTDNISIKIYCDKKILR
jgi:hypothetical protein